MGFISIRVDDFAAGSPDLTHPPPLPGLGTDYVETTRESLPVNLGGVVIYSAENILYGSPSFGYTISSISIHELVGALSAVSEADPCYWLKTECFR
jgi:hypothetical protein